MDNIDKDKLYQAYKQLLEEEAEKSPRTVAESIKEIEMVTGKTIAEITYHETLYDDYYPSKIVFCNPTIATYYAHIGQQKENVDPPTTRISGNKKKTSGT